MSKTITHCILRDGADLELEITACDSLEDDGSVTGFTHEPEVELSPKEERTILELLNEPGERPCRCRGDVCYC